MIHGNTARKLGLLPAQVQSRHDPPALLLKGMDKPFLIMIAGEGPKLGLVREAAADLFIDLKNDDNTMEFGSITAAGAGYGLHVQSAEELPAADPVDLCRHHRGQIEVLDKAVLRLKGLEHKGNVGEVLANITLAHRHLEDAKMRLGKAIQAAESRESCYQKADEVAEFKASRV